MPNSDNETELLNAENALLKFKLESADRLAVHEKAIREIETYKAVVKAIFAFLGIGSLAAWLFIPSAFNRYVDEKVATQLQKWNDLDVGIGLVHQSRWRDALEKLGTLYASEKGAQETKDNHDYQSLLYDSLLYALSSTGELSGDGRWQGDDVWNLLVKDPAFRNKFLNVGETKLDETYCNSLLFCTLKFSRDDPPSTINTIRCYIRRALNTITEDRSKAPHYFDLAMADLVDGKQVSAKQNLKMALDNDPSNYPDPIKSLNGFKNTVQFKMWSHCAERLQKNAFDAAVGDLISDLQREPPK
jgi:hypothetical protein